MTRRCHRTKLISGSLSTPPRFLQPESFSSEVLFLRNPEISQDLITAVLNPMKVLQKSLIGEHQTGQSLSEQISSMAIFRVLLEASKTLSPFGEGYF